MPWKMKTAANLLLRAAGIGLLSCTYFAGCWLRNRVSAGSLQSDPLAYLLVAAAFLSASGGAILTMLGTHIFDRVEVSERWRHTGSD